MNKHTLAVFSQNVRKNKTLTDTILETKKDVINIVLIQEPPCFLIRCVPSTASLLGNPLYGTSSYPNWTLLIQSNSTQENFPRVATYVNKCLSKLRFPLRLNLINHRDINIVTFHNHQNTNLIINVYSDFNQTALHALRDITTYLEKTILMTGDFNLRDNNWDPNFPHHLAHTKDLMTIANSLNLELSPPINPGPTRYADNPNDSNSVLDLVFLAPNNPEFGCHTLHPDIHKPSDHVPLLINVGINEVNINITVQTIKKDSNKEKDFINDITNSVKGLDTLSITSKDDLLRVTHLLAQAYKNAWSKFSRARRITKHSKEWWNQNCTDSLNAYCLRGSLEEWKAYKVTIREAKRTFFDKKIHEIALSNKRPWDLMNGVRKKALPSIETISHKGQPCNTLPAL